MRKKMEECWRVQLLAIFSLAILFPSALAWGDDGHAIVCRIAQCRLSDAAAEEVGNLLPKYAKNDLSSLCAWADVVKKTTHRWSAALHFADTLIWLATTRTPLNCMKIYSGDCKDAVTGEKNRCVVAAINNYTNQLLDYGRDTQYNLTEALLFLSHFIGDIHQPLHEGFLSDYGGNLVAVYWYTRKDNLHRVWDDRIIDTAEERFYGSSMDNFVDAIQHNVTKEWAYKVEGWETCGKNEITCPDTYASESIKVACQWAYQGVTQNATLEDDYFLSRLPIVNLQLAQGGVRLAATLNRIFGAKTQLLSQM